jgi:fluoride exporter
LTEQLPTFLVISAGAVLGANLRYLITIVSVERFGLSFPYGTLFINVTGSLAIGLFVTLATERFALPLHWRLFFATGFLGAYTTFSSYTLETAALLREGAYVAATVYVLGSVILGMIGVLAGIAVAQVLSK